MEGKALDRTGAQWKGMEWTGLDRSGRVYNLSLQEAFRFDSYVD